MLPFFTEDKGVNMEQKGNFPYSCCRNWWWMGVCAFDGILPRMTLGGGGYRAGKPRQRDSWGLQMRRLEFVSVSDRDEDKKLLVSPSKAWCLIYNDATLSFCPRRKPPLCTEGNPIHWSGRVLLLKKVLQNCNVLFFFPTLAWVTPAMV